MPGISIDGERLAALADAIDRFREGSVELTGLDLYYELEAATSLLEFHTVLRHGERNRMRSGLQQSYGDHNRLLMLGLDRFVAGDLDWYRGRLIEPVADDRLQRCFDAVAALQPSRDQLVALWVGGALHDCGMLSGRSGGIDVEDGVELARELVDALCPPETASLALFTVRNHDYVKDLFLGEVPAAFLTDQIADLPADQRALARAALGMVQIAGAASLGEGRLTSFRVAICERCIDGDLADMAPTVERLARLLGDGTEHTGSPDQERARGALAAVDRAARDAVERLLAATPVHRWHRAWQEQAAGSTEDKVQVLGALARVWERDKPDHVVVTPGRVPRDVRSWSPATDIEVLRNGTRALVVV